METMDTKQRIVQEASRLFMQSGLRAVTMDQLCANLGMSKKTLYQFFSDKNALVDACTREMMEHHQVDIELLKQEAVDPIDSLLRGDRYFTDFLSTINGLMLTDLRKYFPDSWASFRQFRNECLLADIRENLQAGITDGLYREGLDLDIVCHFYSGIVDMLFDAELFPNELFDRVAVHQQTISIYLYGISTLRGRQLLDKHLAENQV
ncbi:MAG: TetR/AcrR family transcriptional regulator [Sphingobacteriia bacterium]